ncbi:MAG: A/G-specific adenine glycosylase [Pseudomonadota bacterium]
MPGRARPALPSRPSLLRWYDTHRRQLPWREDPTPFKVLVSELMLQQTQVDKVVPYFERFVRRFPDFEHLAAAPLDDVLALWSGLGYYARARNLHRAAGLVVEKHGGALPSTLDALRTFPGIGPYTAGAVLSIAFAQQVPLVDGNVERVLARWLALDGDPRAAPRKKIILDLASKLVVGPRPGDLNQALMELGALVCRPLAPDCSACPWRRDCAARRQGLQDAIPPPRQRVPRQPLRIVMAVVWQGDSLLFVQRPSSGLFAGLWELPSAEVSAKAPRCTIACELTQALGTQVTLGPKLGSVERTLSHRDLRLEAYAVDVLAVPNLNRPQRFVRRANWSRLGLATALRELLKVLEHTAGA